MDLIFWRHAEAEEGSPDLERPLTAKGVKQAARMTRWLDSRLPESARILVSPAVRARETAKHLDREIETSDVIAPGAEGAALLKAAGWPRRRQSIVLVGHQPSLGVAVALALTGKPAAWRLRKGSIVWLRAGARGEPPLIVAVMAPDLL